MNELEVLEENDRLISNQKEAINTGSKIFEIISKKGPREFLTEVGKMNCELKLKQLEVSESEMRERAAYERTLVNANARQNIAQIENTAKVDIARMKAQTKIIEQKINADTKIRLAEIKTEQLRITEQSKILQKVLEISKAAYDKKMDFYDAQLKSCKEFFEPQIKMIAEELIVLNRQLKQSYDNQKLFVGIQSQIDDLERYKAEINRRYAAINRDLTYAVQMTKIEASNPSAGFLN